MEKVQVLDLYCLSTHNKIINVSIIKYVWNRYFLSLVAVLTLPENRPVDLSGLLAG